MNVKANDPRAIRYLNLRDKDYTIPHEVLRDYLDWQREVERARQLNGDMAMREATVTGQWVERLPQPMRRDMVRDIFSLAAQFGWVIRVDGQHWEQEQQS